MMVAAANDADDFYAQTAAKYTEETGVEIEVIPYPSDAYNTQVTTQLQAGNAADVMILSPGTGQPISVITLAEAGFLEPLDETSAGLLPAGSEGEFQIDGETYAQPTAITPVGMVFNVTAGEEAGIDYPETYDDLLAACTDGPRCGQDLHRPRRWHPVQHRLFSSSSRRPASTRRSRLERAARRGRCDLRRQRMEAGARGHRRDERQRLLPGRRSGRHVRHHHGRARSAARR